MTAAEETEHLILDAIAKAYVDADFKAFDRYLRMLVAFRVYRRRELGMRDFAEMVAAEVVRQNRESMGVAP